MLILQVVACVCLSLSIGLLADNFDDGISIDDVPNDEIYPHVLHQNQENPKKSNQPSNDGNKFDAFLKPYIQRLKEVVVKKKTGNKKRCLSCKIWPYC
jgi:hypothetical protein